MEFLLSLTSLYKEFIKAYDLFTAYL